MANWCILVLVLILLVDCTSVTGVSGMLFELEAGDIKCFSEELNLNALSLGRYHAVSENPLKMSVRVSSPYGSTVHSQEHAFEGEFSFTANEVGTYTACFQIPEAPKNSKIIIDLDWKTGVAAKDWASIAKRDKIEGMELELRKLQDAIQLIHDNMMYLRAKEEQMRNVNEITNSRMAWFSITSIFICLAVASLQLWHLRTFFERKKLL